MYKSRFRGWRFVKNNNRQDVAVMLREKAARSAMGKPTAFYRNGKVVELDRYLRFAIAARQPGADATPSGALPGYIRASTPPAPDVHFPQYLRAPEDLLSQELVLHALRFLAWGSRNQHEPLVDRINSYKVHPAGRAIYDLADDKQIDHYKQAQKLDLLRRRAMGSAHWILVREPSPCALLHFLFSHLSASGELLGEAWQFLADAQNVQRSQDPVSRLYHVTNLFLRNHGFTNLQNHFLHILSRLATTPERQLGLPEYTTCLLAGFPPPGSFSTEPASTLSSQLVHHYRTDYLRCMQQQPGLSRWQLRGLLCYELRIVGQQSRWRSDMVSHLANEILDLALSPFHAYSCWQAKRAIASYHRAKFEDEAPAPSPHHGLARMYLEETIHLAVPLDCMRRGLDVVPDIALLERWCAEANDVAKVAEVRALLRHVLAESSAFLLGKD